MMIKQTEDEIQDQIDKAAEHDKSLWSGMSYEEGVIDALEWVLGGRESAPMDEED